jgi:large subunit ribosomal protein L10
VGLAITKEKKAELVAGYVEQLKESQGIIFADYRGLSVNDMSDIRNQVRPMGAKFQVVKNRLLALALKETDLSLPDEWLSGPTVVGFCHDEVPPVAKVLVDRAKDLEVLQIKGGFLGGSILEAAEVKAIADLPPREVLLAQVLGGINAPASQMVGVVASGIRQVLNVLQAYVDKLEEAGGGMEPVAEPA